MTTRTDPLPLVAVPSGRFPWQRLTLSFAITLLAVALFALAFAIGYVRLHEDRVVPGVEVAGVSLAGLDRLEAETRLREALPSLSSGHLTVRFGGEQARIRYSEIGRDYNMSLMLDQAFSLGRDGGLFEQAQEQLRILLHGVSVEPSLVWDSEQLASRVTAVAEPGQIEPVDARIVREDGRYAVIPAMQGQSVDAEGGVELASAAINNLSAADTRVTFEAVPVSPAVSTEAAQAAVDRFERVTAEPLTVSGGGQSAVIEAERILGWTRLEEESTGVWSLVIEEDPIRQFVEHYALEVDTPAENASFAFSGEEVVAVPGSDGQAVDVETSTSNILAALEGRADATPASEATMAVSVVEPELSYAQAAAMAPRVEILSRWRTNYVPGPMNYEGLNITIPTEKIDGTVVNPGETFDFWDVVGEPSVADGYGPGGAIIRNRTVPDGALAGGICSCSTTIFNAALRAGLDMGSRKNHSYYISRYPVGLDATVWIGDDGARQSMRFTNDMQHPVLIRGINRPGAVIFQVWGIPDGRTVEFSEPRIENRKEAYEVLRYTDNPEVRPGQRKRVEYPADGFEAYVTRTVRDADGRVIHSDEFYSRYRMIKGITLVGRAEGDPPHGTEVRRGGEPDED